MKWMKKLRLINWHYFTDETMEFGKQTLITGQNGAGKSTIIDAMQVIFVADQRNIRFNPAAHDEAKRSLINYLKGKIGSDDRTFVRDGDFTTYIAAEFRDDEKRESFVIGVVIDVFRDLSYDEEYFILADCRLDELEFVKHSGELRNREEFRRLYGGASGGGARVRSIFERNKSNYQKALLNRMGQLHERFFSIFIKALSFKPIQNIRDFVYDYILDRRELQLDLMKQNFEIHERYQQELEELLKRREKLQGIRERYQQFGKLRETVKEQDYVIRRLKLQLQQEYGEDVEHQLQRLEEKLTRKSEESAFAERKQEEARTESQEAYRRWQSHAAERRKKELTEDIQRREDEKMSLQKQLAAFASQVRRELELLQALEGWGGTEEFGLDEAYRHRLNHSLEVLSHVLRHAEQEQPPDDPDGEIGIALGETGGLLADCYQQMVKASSKLEYRLTELHARVTELEQVIRDLENQKRTYPASVQKLKDLLTERLQGRSRVRIFCEEMEFEDESWRNAVEGYLNTHRFDLLVEPHVFAEALSLYEHEKLTYKLEGVGLVDTEKEAKYAGTAQPNSLAEALQAEDPVVRAHLEHLLGKVMRAKDEQDLRNYRTAVTRTCMVYSNLVARQIPKHQYEVPFIGLKAIVRQLEIKRDELAQAAAEMKRLRAALDELNQWTGKLREKQSQYDRLIEALPLRAHLQSVVSLLDSLHSELSRLDVSEADRLKALYEQWTAAEREWKDKHITAVREYERLGGEKKHLVTERHLHATKTKEAEDYCEQWIATHDADALQRALSRWEEAARLELATARKIDNWESNWKGNQTRRDQEFHDLQLLRQKYNIDYSFNTAIDDEGNDAYESLLHDIEHLNIPEYQQKVEKALNDSEEEFKSHFIFKLREAIEMARREFHELNFALRNFPFSEDKYHFEVTASEKYKRFYDAVMDPHLMERGSLFDMADSERADVLHELFELLVRGEGGDLEEFTDYRRYLDFDIIVQSRDSRYRFSQVLKEKSGGETQTPFYIAILASFHHLYSSGKTMRLVVFDEAFNKMDEQRIQTSLRLIKQLRLQLIASVPDEKMQHMAPEVTTTLIVSNHNYQCFVDMIDRWDEETDEASADAGTGTDSDSENEQVRAVEQETLF